MAPFCLPVWVILSVSVCVVVVFVSAVSGPALCLIVFTNSDSQQWKSLSLPACVGSRDNDHMGRDAAGVRDCETHLFMKALCN